MLTSCCNTNSGYISTKGVVPLDKIGHSVVQDPLLQISHCMYTNSQILTTLYAHVLSTRLRFEFILMITRTGSPGKNSTFRKSIQRCLIIIFIHSYYIVTINEIVVLIVSYRFTASSYWIPTLACQDLSGA